MERGLEAGDAPAAHHADAHAENGVAVRERSGGRSAEIEQVLALLRQPKTARQAVMATVILGPPRALEG